MHQKNIKRILSRMSKEEFESLVPHVLKATSGLVPVCVDGSNDGSVDYHLYNGLEKSRYAVQTTDTWQNLERKITNNALDVAGRNDIDIYYMIVKEVVSNDVKERLEAEALKHKLHMKIWGANEVSDFIRRYNLEDELYRIARLDQITVQPKSLERPEVLLHTYLSMSTDRRDLNDEMIDSSIEFLLYNEKKMNRDELVARTLQLLRMPESHKYHIKGRIDSLGMKRMIEVNGNLLDLSSQARNEINKLVADYDIELNMLANVCVETIKEVTHHDLIVSPPPALRTGM